MKNRRRVVQILLFIFFLVIFFKTVQPYNLQYINVFMRLSPLNSVMLLLLGKITVVFIPGLFLLLLTALFGRFFCGWMCPMGTTLDLAEKITGGGDNPKESKKIGWIRYFILFSVLTAGALGLSKAYLFEPMALSYRFYTYSLFPVFDRLWKYLRGVIPAFSKMEYMTSFVDVTYRTGVFFFLFFLGIILLGRIYRRYWCRNLCPLGALFSIFGRFSLIQKKVSDACIDCGKCTRKCKMGAIPADPRDFDVSQCIYCFDCVDECLVNAISFKPGPPYKTSEILPSIKSFIKGKPSPAAETSTGFTRRMFLGAVGLGAATAAVAGVDHNAKYPDPRLIRPPAALPGDEFNDACIRCGECMKVCVTGGLQPTLFEAGLPALLTPRLLPAVGYCQYKCNMCSQVCPTGAIQPFEVQDKPYIKLGLANLNRSTCLVWAGSRDCLVCDEYCPYKAIDWKEIDGRPHPFVNENVCVGCGTCEKFCPIKPDAAIRVYSQGENRIRLKPGESWIQVNPPKSESEAPGGEEAYPPQ